MFALRIVVLSVHGRPGVVAELPVTAFSDHLNTVRTYINAERGKRPARSVPLAALDAIEAAYKQVERENGQAWTEYNDAEAEVERLRAELAATQRALNVGTFPLATRGDETR